jgi:DNA-binding response OmpR family regulator
MAILLIEDEAVLRDEVSFILQRAGHTVIKATSSESGLRLWREHEPDLVLLDIRLPDIAASELFRTIRAGNKTPVVILAEAEAEDDLMRILHLGLDGYITKPFNPKHLQARVEAALRLQTPVNGTVTAPATLHLDSDHLELTYGLSTTQLTHIEFRIVETLAANMGHVVPYAELIRVVWGFMNEAGSKIMKVHISNLRAKFSRIGFKGSIESIAGVGYVLKPR